MRGWRWHRSDTSRKDESGPQPRYIQSGRGYGRGRSGAATTDDAKSRERHQPTFAEVNRAGLALPYSSKHPAVQEEPGQQPR